ncbi:hypothetical protein HNQ71_003393 [Mesorhizobium sangaii]|uniref:Uncharacterized protein n=1 Tax=Mesorhizobium sangaii TaxID=505389 RepID=A0A841PKW2_9HYPH|nr:hypothetical protein [Mesorhizobium sangaii]
MATGLATEGFHRSSTAAKFEPEFPITIAVIAAIAGGFGVVSGFALYFFLLHFVKDGTFNWAEMAQRTCVGLLTGAIGGFVFELIRDAIHDGERLGWKRRGFEMAGTLMLFGIFAVALDHLPETISEAEKIFFSSSTEEILGVTSGHKGRGYAPVFIIVLLWLAIGAAASASLAVAVWYIAAAKSLKEGLGLSLIGSAVGLMIVMGAVTLYMIVARLVVLPGLIAGAPGSAASAWKEVEVIPLFRNMAASAQSAFSEMRAGNLLPALGAALPLLVWVWVLVSAITRGEHRWVVVAFIILPPALFIFAPVAVQILAVLATTAVIWFAPLLALGLVLPFLKRASSAPRYWGYVAFGMALMTILLWWVRGQMVFGYLALALVCVGFVLMWRNDREWPWSIIAVIAGLLLLSLVSVQTTVAPSEEIFRDMQKVAASKELFMPWHTESMERIVHQVIRQPWLKWLFDSPRDSQLSGAPGRQLSAKEKSDLDTALSEYARREMRNTLTQETPETTDRALWGLWGQQGVPGTQLSPEVLKSLSQELARRELEEAAARRKAQEADWADETSPAPAVEAHGEGTDPKGGTGAVMFEPVVMGAYGFWTVLGALAAWSISDRRRSGRPRRRARRAPPALADDSGQSSMLFAPMSLACRVTIRHLPAPSRSGIKSSIAAKPLQRRSPCPRPSPTPWLPKIRFTSIADIRHAAGRQSSTSRHLLTGSGRTMVPCTGIWSASSAARRVRSQGATAGRCSSLWFPTMQAYRLGATATGNRLSIRPNYDPLVLSVLPINLYLPLTELPSAPAPVIMASAIRLAIRAYSMAVTPDSSWMKRAITFCMSGPLPASIR